MYCFLAVDTKPGIITGSHIQTHNAAGITQLGRHKVFATVQITQLDCA